MSSQDELVAEAELGEEAKQFLESDLGKCLIGMAQQEVLLAQEALGSVDPTDVKAIMALQNKMHLGMSFEGWLLELIDKGNAAIQVYKHSQEN